MRATNALNQVTTNSYDATWRQLTNVARPTGLSTAFQYDGDRRLQKAIDVQIARTNTYTYYSTNGLVQTHTDPRGLNRTYLWDNLQRMTRINYPDSTYEQRQFTHLDLTGARDRLGNWTYFAYNGLRQKVAETNSLGHVTASRQITETNANLEVVRQTYNAAGDLLTLKDGKNQTTTWNYDLYGRVTNKVDQASAQILRYQYAVSHRLTNRWSAAKGNTTYRYDKVGNLTNVVYASSPAVTNWFDALNRLSNMVDAVGTTRYTYHLNGQLLTEDGPWANDTVTYGYNNARLRSSLSLQQPTGSWTNGFGYDTARRRSTVISPAGTYTYTFKGQGTLVTNLALPNSSNITNAFDNVGRLTLTRLRTSGGTTRNRHSYLYNQGHQRYRQTRTDGSYATYTYDNIGQLKSAMGTGNQSTENLGYAYEAAWNLNTRTNYSTPQTFAVNVKIKIWNAS